MEFVKSACLFYFLLSKVNTQHMIDSVGHRSQDNHKPMFRNCEQYSNSVIEEETKNTLVVTVQATDEDPPDHGGTVSYQILQKIGERKSFNINNKTGEIYNEVSFDRDEPSRQKEVYISVQATDNGRPPLADICTFKVTVLDKNDNKPSFDQATYSSQVSEDRKPNSEVMRVFAFDFDDGDNSRLTYSFQKNDSRFNEYFKMDSETGVIYLTQTLKTMQGTKFEEVVRVSDNGRPPFDNTADISITVVGSEKQPPTITSDQLNITLKENYNKYDIDEPLFVVYADSKIDDKSIVFELMKGKTTQTNKDQTFLLTQQDTRGIITLGRPLDYETVTEYTLTVRARNKDMLDALLTLKIKIEDVNDEIPTFFELITGSVLENDVIGATAMQVRAIDKDGTAANNIVSYELLSHSDKFVIDRETGVIKANATFDREKEKVYHVNVRAYDNSPSAIYTNNEPNSATQIFQITIEDKNDNAPKFTNESYVVHNISENIDTSSIVIEVQAYDSDTASLINYSIVDGNTDGDFMIEPPTGRIKVKNKLDFERTENYTLTVTANDGIFNDTAKVYIYILNENDEPPKFGQKVYDIVIDEEKVNSSCVAHITAIDPDIKNGKPNQGITFEVQNNYSKISSDGCITIIKPLDRDLPNGSPIIQTFVGAQDHLLGAFAEVKFHLNDINDNAPFLNVTEVIWYENEGLDSTPIATLSADDYDSDENGPPFKFSLDDTASSEVRDNFKIIEDKIFAKNTFDRERTKFFNVPVNIQDSGTPQLNGTSILKVIIGDRNDNAAESGSSFITVFKYEKLNEDINIGRVYVNDPDDWDLSDKEFQFKDYHPNFYLKDSDNGMVVMKKDTEAGFYRLQFTVTETHLPNIPTHSVDATVDILVKVIPKEAVDKSGSIRVKAPSIGSLIERNGENISKLDVLRKYLSKYMNTSEENVDVFTVVPAGPYFDIRFSAHGSPYYAPEKINHRVSEHQDELEIELGITIEQIGVSECLNETVCNGSSCTSNLNILEEPAVIFGNKTSFVGVKAIVEALCSCIDMIPNGCNSGEMDERNICICPQGHDGPNCEITSIGFGGNGWALYPTFEACATTSISLSIVPQTPNGLIFYTGPSTLQQAKASKDFLSLELRDGVVILKLDFGYGPLEIEAAPDKKLTDGSVHDIEIKYGNNEIQLIVDECGSSCLKWQSLPMQKGLLNVNGPLQIGGLTHSFSDEEFRLISDQSAPSSKGFIGCIKNFKHNNYLYNLGKPSDHGPSININCNWGYAEAVVFGIDSNFLVAVLLCVALFIILLLAVVVYHRKLDNSNEKDIDDTRATIINYEDEGGGESDASFDLSVLRPSNMFEKPQIKDNFQTQEVLAALPAFLDNKKDGCDKNPENLPFDDVRHYAYEGDGNSTGSLSSLASCTDEGDLKFNYLSNFGPRFRKLADMYGNDNSDDDSQENGEESWC